MDLLITAVAPAGLLTHFHPDFDACFAVLALGARRARQIKTISQLRDEIFDVMLSFGSQIDADLKRVLAELCDVVVLNLELRAHFDHVFGSQRRLPKQLPGRLLAGHQLRNLLVS